MSEDEVVVLLLAARVQTEQQPEPDLGGGLARLDPGTPVDVVEIRLYDLGKQLVSGLVRIDVPAAPLPSSTMGKVAEIQSP